MVIILDPVVLSAIGIIVALVSLCILCFKGFHPAIVGILASSIVAVTGGQNLLTSLLDSYLPGAASFFAANFLVFLFSALLGKIYSETGAAKTVAESLVKLFGPRLAILAVGLAGATLTFGGITAFVVIFAIYPVALVLFEKADIPDRLIPGVVCWGVMTFALTGPGSTQIHNVMAMNALGTSSVAGGIPGAVASVCLFLFGFVYLKWEERRMRMAGEHFQFPSHVQRFEDDRPRPHIIPSLFPLAFVLVAFNLFQWNIIVALFLAVALSTLLFFKHFPKGKLLTLYNEGASSAVTIIINTAAVVGFGSVVKSVSFFEKAVEFLSQSTLHPYLVCLTTANGLGGLMGSAVGSIGLTLSTLDGVIAQWVAQGYDVGYIHRLITIGSGGLDSLPHCGAIISVLAVCGMSHKKGYLPIFMVTVLSPFVVGYCIMLPLMIFLG